MTTEQREELHGWKEIAWRFQVSVRTAQLWEKERGMPVRRLPPKTGGRVARVFAIRMELDEWARSEGMGPGRNGAGDRRTSARSRSGRFAAAGIVFAAAALGMTWLVLTPGHTELASWSVLNDTLIVRDESGREAWRKTFDADLPEAVYRGSSYLHPQFVDLNGDGVREVLFIATSSDTTRSSVLWCLSNAGDVLWNFQPGAPIATETEDFDEIFVVAQARPAKLGPDGAVSIVVTTHQLQHYPTQVAVLDSAGDPQAEYWHAGHIGGSDLQLAIADLDADGWSEIYAAGVSNGRNQATLVALDPRTMSGAGSETDPGHRFLGMKPGTGAARIWFPRTALSHASGDPYNVATSLTIGRGAITVGVLESLVSEAGPMIHYRLRPDLSVERASETDTYRGDVAGAIRAVESMDELARRVQIDSGDDE